ncbi:C-reactive protein-like [Pantherophis guttatus]|uniref:Pentraxin family member n=1 Tax=Pantherophis guttatus TaxID=94885 RepID=A0A6P9B085_PANGU|nr:C-reactive protein-like [Pantherophis guttatus]
MAILLSLLVILACLSGSFGEEDLQKKVFVFPAASRKAFVRLNVHLPQPLTSLSVCLKHHCPLLRPYSLFSYATRSSDNDFLIFKEEPNVYSISVGGSDVRFKIPRQDIPRWEHICVSWDSRNGLIYFWLDGVLLPRLGTKRGHKISHQASIILGQDQDTFGGGFDIYQSFMGDMSEVNMWPRVLTTDDVRLLMKDDTVPNPLASWNAFNYTIQDYVVVTDEVP